MPTAAASSLPPPRPTPTFWRDLWARTALQGLLVVAGYFAIWEIVEGAALPAVADPALRALHLVRGAGAAFMLGTWSFLRIRQARLECDAATAAAMTRLEQRVRERTRELEEARAFTELLFDSLRERIVVVGDGGRIVKANRVAEDVAGRPLVGERSEDAFPNDTREGACTDARGRLWELEAVEVRDAPRGAAYVIEVGRDVTAAKNLEAQLRHQEKMASLGVLAAGFAHDLGNPLASLSTELELLETEEDMAQVRASLDVLRQQVARMIRTLREMVDFARRRREEVADVSIAAAVADSARLICHDPRWNRMRLVVDVPPEVPCVRMVEDHLVLVLVNLMLNAIDAMPTGGTLSVTGRQRDDEVEVVVRDTGHGMAADVLARAKTPLFTTKGARGTGLGLPVCDDVVRAIGGRLDLSSEPERGTVVTVHLPAGSEPNA